MDNSMDNLTTDDLMIAATCAEHIEARRKAALALYARGCTDGWNDALDAVQNGSGPVVYEDDERVQVPG
jgi:hypothetical protein